MSNYTYNYIDLDEYYEPLIVGGYEANSGTPSEYKNMTAYASYTNDFLFYKKPNDPTYKKNNVTIPCCAVGYRPRITSRYIFDSAGTYYITRTSSGMTIWNSSGTILLNSATFSSSGNSISPFVLLFSIIGGGGNGGFGDGGQAGGSNKSGAGGAGGGKVVGYATIPTTTNMTSGLMLVVGANTYDSYVKLNDYKLIAYAGGNGASSGGSGGIGGSGDLLYSDASTSNTSSIGLLSVQDGGNGGRYLVSGSTSAALTQVVTPENLTLTINAGSGGSAPDGGGGGGSEGAGGNGGYGANGSPGVAPGGGGGGGGDAFWSGNIGGAGAIGQIRIYY